MATRWTGCTCQCCAQTQEPIAVVQTHLCHKHLQYTYMPHARTCTHRALVVAVTAGPHLQMLDCSASWAACEVPWPGIRITLSAKLDEGRDADALDSLRNAMAAAQKTDGVHMAYNVETADSANAGGDASDCKLTAAQLMRYTVTLSLSTAVLPQFGVLHDCSTCTNSKKAGAAEQPLQLSPNVAAWALLDLVWLYTIADDHQASSEARVLHCVQAAEIRIAPRNTQHATTSCLEH